jgi:hypothetical protein
VTVPPTSDHFERPVIIFNCFGIPTAISSAMEAYMFLTDLAARHQDAAAEFARKACLAAVRGEVEPDTARGLVSSWAERRGLLGTDFAAFVSSQASKPHSSA